MEERLLPSQELDHLNQSGMAQASSEGSFREEGTATGDPFGEAKGTENLIGEQPKVVLEKEESGIYRELFFVHAVPVVITVALLVLYIRRVSWTPPWPTTNVLNALQFAAKLHESLILFSLSMVLYQHIKYRLISAKDVGVHLGLVCSSFQLSSPLFLVNREFFAIVSNLRRLSARDTLTLSLLFYMFVLAAVSGPSTAIAMIPKLDWWPYPPVWLETWSFTQPLRHYYAVPFDQLYPLTINSSAKLDNCSFALYNLSNPVNALQDFGNQCPLMGYLDIAGNFNQTYLQLKEGYNSNVTVQGSPATFPYGGPRNILARLPFAQPFLSPIAYATTPLDSVGIAARKMKEQAADFTQDMPTTTLTFRVLANDSAGVHAWKQPLVRTQCSSYWANDSYIFEYPSEETKKQFQFQAGFNDGTSPATMNTSSLMILDTKILNISPYFAPSAAIAVTNGTIQNGTLCIISAEWVDADLTVTTPSSNDLPEFTIDTPSGDITQSGPNLISLDQQWLVQLNNNWTATYMTNVTHMCGVDISCLSLAYSLGVAEALARMQHRFGDWFSVDPLDSLGDLHNVTNVTYDVLRYVYLYAFGSVTVYLAFAVLLLHVLTVVAHVFVQCCSREGIISAWPTLGQVLVLALQSPSPSPLRNTGSGVNAAQTWRLRAAVRDLTEDSKIGIVVSEGGYGTAQAGEENKNAHLRAGYKYA